MDEGRIIEDDEVKRSLATKQPFSAWLRAQRVGLDDLPEPEFVPGDDPATLQPRQRAHGYTSEELAMLVGPMAD